MLRALPILIVLTAGSPASQSGSASLKGQSLSHWLQALEDADPKAHNAAVQALSAMNPVPPETLPALQHLLRSSSWPVRHRALMVLGNLGTQARPAHGDILASLQDEQLEVRRKAAATLRRVPADSRKGRMGLVAALRHEDDYIRREISYALGEQAKDAGDIAGELGALVGNADSSVRTAALQLLIKLDPDAALPVLIPRLEAGEPATQQLAVARQGAAQAIGTFGERAGAAVPALMRLLGEREHRLVALDALEALGVASRPAVPALVDLLKTSAPSSDAYQGAARALGAIGPEARAALPFLRETLDHAPLNEATGRGRKAALDAIRHILAPADPGLTGYARRLARALDDRDAFMRAEAARSLVDLGPAAAPAMEELRRVLKRDAVPKIRYLAAEALGAIGAKARPAMEDLRNASTDEDPSVWRKAGEALAILAKPGDR